MEGGANIFGGFRVKNHDFTQKNHIFSNFRGGAPWIRPWVLCLYIYCTLCLDKRLILSMPIYYCSFPLIMSFPLKAIPSSQGRFHIHWNSKILLYCPLREAMPHIRKRCHCRRWPYKWGTTEFWCCNTSTVAWDDITLPYSPYRILQMECLHAVYPKLITLCVFTVKEFDPTL